LDEDTLVLIDEEVALLGHLGELTTNLRHETFEVVELKGTILFLSQQCLAESLCFFVFGMWLLLVCLFLILYLIWRYIFSSFPLQATEASIPLVQPCYPLLGNALDYKSHPDQFLLKQHQRYGGIFEINLAGMKTIILTSDSILKQFDSMSEKALSSQVAVADIGFEFTLGNFNIYFGTAIHKLILKNYFSSSQQITLITKSLQRSIRRILDKESTFLSPTPTATDGIQKSDSVKRRVIPDFFHFIRRIILLTIIEEFLSPQLVEYYQHIVTNTRTRTDTSRSSSSTQVDFVTDFMELQDEIERATATAAVLPRWLALPLCLWRCEKNRKVLVERLERVIQTIGADVASGKLSSEAEGIWLKGMKEMKREGSDDYYCNREIAELFIGLLFAAHKNPGTLLDLSSLLSPHSLLSILSFLSLFSNRRCPSHSLPHGVIPPSFSLTLFLLHSSSLSSCTIISLSSL
jgi:hypothetical protein